MRHAIGFGLVTLMLTLQPAFSQFTTGSVAGSVTDPSGAAIPDAELTLTHVTTGRERRSVTTEVGDFVFAGVEPGEYRITASKDGFKRLEKRGLFLSAGERLAIGNLTLELGGMTEVVSVVAEGGAVVQTQTAERSDMLTTDQVDELLNLGRNVTSLLALMPGVVVTQDSQQLGRRTDFSVMGNRRTQNNISIDGIPAVDVGNSFAKKLVVSQDMVSEVKVLMTNYQAEYGRMAGSNVHIVTKSGAQQFHGLLSYFKRHEQFNANNFFNNRNGVPKPRYRFNTWTYNIGGPVYIPGKFNENKNKMFFFWGQEFWPTTQGVTRQVTMPTGLEQAGDFSQSIDLNDQLINVKDPFNGGAPFPGNRIPGDRIDPNGQALMNVFPGPNFLDRSVSNGAYNYIFTADNDLPTRTETLKVDYNFNDRNMIFATYSGYYEEATGSIGFPTGGAQNWDQWGEYSFLGDTQGIATRYTKIFSPTVINELHFGLLRHPEKNEIDESLLPPNQRAAVGYAAGQLFGGTNPLDLIPDATFGGVPNFASLNKDGRFPFEALNYVLNWDNKTTFIRGSHTVKAGLYVEWFLRDIAQSVEFSGQYNFGRDVNNPLDTNYAYSNAMLGVFNQYTESSARPFAQTRNTIMEGFIQDTWRVNRKLTLDYGLRLQWMPPITHKEDLIAGFVDDRYDPSQQVSLLQPGMDAEGSRVAVHPLTGETFAANLIGAIAPNSGNPVNGMVAVRDNPDFPRGLTESQGVKLGPRFGFAYDPFGKGKTAVRGGFGIFYQRPNFGTWSRIYSVQPPLLQAPVLFHSEISRLQDSAGFLFPANVEGLDPDARIPMVMNYNLSIQQNIGFGTVVDIAYVGNLGRHQLWKRDINPIPLGANFDPANEDPTRPGRPLTSSFLRPRVGHNNIRILEPAGSSHYHSLQVTAKRRFARGLQFGLSWTWSKAMDFNDNDANVITSLVDPRVRDYGPAGFDRTHVLKINYLWDIPEVRWDNPIAKYVVNGWQLSGITSFVSGQPLTPGLQTTTPTDFTGTASLGARALMVADPTIPKSERTFDRHFNTAAFALPPIGSFGDVPKGAIRGPGINNFDIAVFKNIPVHERLKLQFRWEMYNAFNHTQFSGVDTVPRFDPQGNQVNGRFGQYTSAHDARIMQVALRLSF